MMFTRNPATFKATLFHGGSAVKISRTIEDHTGSGKRCRVSKAVQRSLGKARSGWAQLVRTAALRIPNYGPLVFDAAGNLYGATSDGGANGFGAVYKLAPL